MIHKGRELQAAADSLYEYSTVLQALPDCPPPTACRNLERLCVRHLVLLGPAEIPTRPKHHLWYHLVFRTVC
eukprot:9484459-Pyramimonas_sp.AAC.1